MRASITIHCERPDCTNTVTAEWDPGEWWCVRNFEVVLDGRIDLAAGGWEMPGPKFGTDSQPTFCPEHARVTRLGHTFG